MFTASHLKAFGRYEYFPFVTAVWRVIFLLKKKRVIHLDTVNA